MNHQCKYPDNKERLDIIDAKITDIDHRLEKLEDIKPMPSVTFFEALKTIQAAQTRLENMMVSFQEQLEELSAKIAKHQAMLSNDQAEVVKIKEAATDKRTRLICACGLTAVVIVFIFLKPALAEINSFNVITYASCTWLFGESFMNLFAKKIGVN